MQLTGETEQGFPGSFRVGESREGSSAHHDFTDELSSDRRRYVRRLSLQPGDRGAGIGLQRAEAAWNLIVAARGSSGTPRLPTGVTRAATTPLATGGRGVHISHCSRTGRNRHRRCRMSSARRATPP